MRETFLAEPDAFSRTAPKNGLAPWQEARARKMLLENLACDISLGELAKACGLSLTYFSRAFKNSTGSPPHAWLTKQRVGKAMNLMLQSDTALSDIALISGFADQSHFTRVFSKTIGISPGAWRRAHRLLPGHAAGHAAAFPSLQLAALGS